MYSSAKKLRRVLSSQEIRKIFIDYFIKNHDHKFIRSSPVVPFSDKTVAFVNAGMNQFKSVFLGTTQPLYKRVANSQKCVRVGGKHNDLSVVGEDGYHHTFFEMLGNWSFGDYFKREACSMALELLREPYNIDTSRLYVTYFAGDKVLDLPADLECFEIWRSLGFPASRILPFGSKENFWEMGPTGPCGPCTEIHIDHRPDLTSEHRAAFVNTGRSDLTELWNLVFIQYNRNDDGSITELPAKHVDTGMGFERLTAVLQNKSSNYNTDLFVPLFDAIHKISKAPEYQGAFPSKSDAAALDTGYRILADHARMVSVCLADGMLPDQNHKLRRVLRKALKVGESTFGNENLLSQLIPVAADTLGAAYPEIQNKQTAILELIAHEQEVFRALLRSSSKAFSEALYEFPNLQDMDIEDCPGFLSAYKEFQSVKHTFQNNNIPGYFLYKLSDTFGLTEEHLKKLAELEEMSYNVDDYNEALLRAKQKSKNCMNKNTQESHKLLQSIKESLINLTKTLPPTDNHHKYNYRYDEKEMQYTTPALKTKVLGILYNDVSVHEVVCNGIHNSQDVVSIVTESSNFYYESGGQQTDKGVFVIKPSSNDRQELKVKNVHLMNDCVIHTCELPSEKCFFNLAIGDAIELVVDSQHRKNNTCHHTATHLLNAAIRSLFNKVTYQVSSAVTSDHCKLEVGLIGKHITIADVDKIEEFINQVISSAIPVNAQLCNAAEILQQNDVIMVPGETYPEKDLRLITIKCDNLNLLSKELCCGTHVTNTQELEYFCITNLKQTNRARFAFTAAAGEAAAKAFQTAGLLKHRIDMLQQTLLSDKNSNGAEVELQTIRHNLLHMDIPVPYNFKMNAMEHITGTLLKLRKAARTNIKELVEVEMRTILQDRPTDTYPFILHFVSSSALMQEFSLQKATRLCPDRPILVISKCDNIVKARCCVPKQNQNSNFNAEKWLNEFASIFEGRVAPPKGQNRCEVCNMKGKRTSTHFEEQLEIAMRAANKFALENLK